MTDKKRIEDLERRVRELETKPPAIVIVPSLPVVIQPTIPQPWIPYYPPWQPTWISNVTFSDMALSSN